MAAKKYGVPPIAPLGWLLRYGGSSLAVLAGADPRVQRAVPRVPREMFSLPVPKLASKWVVPEAPPFRHLVFVGSPALVRAVFAGDPTKLHFGAPNPLGKMTGEKSLFSLDEGEHLEQRKIILPPLHGARMHAYESIVEEETLREIETWSQGVELRTTEPFMRITLNIILRAVFGIRDGALMDELRIKTPQAVKLGSRLMGMGPIHLDLGPRSPYGRFRALIQRFEWGVHALLDQARRDPNLADREDVLALLAQATHEDDGSLLTDRRGRARDDREHARVGGRASLPPPGDPPPAPARGGRGRQGTPRGDDPRASADPARDPRHRPDGRIAVRARRLHPAAGDGDPAADAIPAQRSRDVPRPAQVRSRPVPWQASGSEHVDPVRGRGASLPRRRVRAHGDGHRTADAAR
jgi:hypothetical protein